MKPAPMNIDYWSLCSDCRGEFAAWRDGPFSSAADKYFSLDERSTFGEKEDRRRRLLQSQYDQIAERCGRLHIGASPDA
jgi:hypothetical protein